METNYQKAVSELTIGLCRTFEDLWPKLKTKYALDDDCLRVAVLSAGAHFLANTAQEHYRLTDEKTDTLVRNIDQALVDIYPIE